MNNDEEVIVNISLSSIRVDAAWNARSGAWKLDSGFDEESAFAELKASIRVCGVKDPVKVRPTPNADRPFALVSGFRRYAASEELERETIPAVVREMTDAEARLENTRENTARSELRAADLAWAVGELVKLGLSDTVIASAVGITQPYASKLHRIMSKVEPKITAHWRTTVYVITVDAMHTLTKLPVEQQHAHYQKLQHGAADDQGRRHKRGRMQRLAEDAREIGSRLGVLVRLKYIVPASSDFEEMVETVIKIPASATVRHRRALADAMAQGFARGVQTPGDDSRDNEE
jgi:ParB family chromosome partitioning protein